MSAVKPRERSDQYRILSALFCLGGARSPTTTAQVTKLLKLHFGSNAPPNVSSSLKAYAEYVSPVSGGPRRTWILTPKGLAKLRDQSGLGLKTSIVDAGFQTDIAVLCALEHPEFSAVMNAFGGAECWEETGSATHSHVYRRCRMTTSQGQALDVVGTTATSMGLTAAAIATTQMIHVFRPRIVLMVGIAAGTKSGKKEFGDVLVADPSVDYNSGKVVSENGVRGFQPDPYPIGLHPRIRSLLMKYRRPTPLFGQIRSKWNGRPPAEVNKLHVGPLGAADQVIDDESRILEVQKNWRKLIGVEMETYGVYRACHEAPEPKPRFLSIKSVCDFAAEKSDDWQDFAAFSAAEFAFRFLSEEWHNLWPSEQAEAR